MVLSSCETTEMDALFCNYWMLTESDCSISQQCLQVGINIRDIQ